MKKYLRWVARKLTRNDVCWGCARATLVRAGETCSYLRGAALREACNAWCGKHLADQLVLHGPFKGLKCHEFSSFGSMLYPKLIGCYESEIQEVVGKLISGSFDVIVDVGCAEGYYAVGFARGLSTATVYAFDTDQAAQEACRAMAECNHVSDRVVVGAFCDANTLMELATKTSRGLLICDCEGFERYLFTESCIAALRSWHIVIETHDFISRGVTEHLIKLFAGSHHIQEIDAISDAKKSESYNYPELRGLNASLRDKLVSEKRPDGMKWLYMSPLYHPTP